jgi:hypothetical protein
MSRVRPYLTSPIFRNPRQRNDGDGLLEGGFRSSVQAMLRAINKGNENKAYIHAKKAFHQAIAMYFLKIAIDKKVRLLRLREAGQKYVK